VNNFGTMFDWYRRRWLDLVASIYLYNEHRGYTAIDRVLTAMRAAMSDDPLIIEVEQHRADEYKHYLMFRRWFEKHSTMPYFVDRTCGHIDRFIEIMFGSHIDDIDPHALIRDDRNFEKMCRIVALTERRGYRQLDILLAHPLIRGDRQLTKMFEIIREDEPRHWTPYESWLKRHGRRDPAWWERWIDRFIHSELLLIKLPLLFLTPHLRRRSRWPDEDDTRQGHAQAAAAAV
jgi:rubrerythrin